MDSSDNERSFTVSVVGSETGTLWNGSFKTKIRLSHRDHVAKDRLRREILSGPDPETADGRALNIALLVAELSVRLTSYPEWWEANGKGLDFFDEEPLSQTYDGMIKKLVEARKEKEAMTAEAKKELRTEAAKSEV